MLSSKHLLSTFFILASQKGSFSRPTRDNENKIMADCDYDVMQNMSARKVCTRLSLQLLSESKSKTLFRSQAGRATMSHNRSVRHARGITGSSPHPRCKRRL